MFIKFVEIELELDFIWFDRFIDTFYTYRLLRLWRDMLAIL